MRKTMRRFSGTHGVTLNHGVLNLDGAAYGLDDAAELDDRAVASALDNATVMHGNSRVDQIAAQRSKQRQDAILVRTGESAIPNHIGAKNRSQFPGVDHRSSPPPSGLAQTRANSSPSADISHTADSFRSSRVDGSLRPSVVTRFCRQELRQRCCGANDGQMAFPDLSPGILAHGPCRHPGGGVPRFALMS